MRWATLAAFLAGGVLAAGTALAQVPPASRAETTSTPEPGAKGDETAGAKVREWVQKGSQKVVEINFDEAAADKIYGKVQKPGVDYLITQGDLSYEGLPMEHDLIRVLEDSVRKPPF
jgi:hypothetical protein